MPSDRSARAPNRQAPSTGLSAAGACAVPLLWLTAALAHPGVSEDVKAVQIPMLLRHRVTASEERM